MGELGKRSPYLATDACYEDPRLAVLARDNSNCEGKTHPLITDGVPT
jgi:hypothetical protein